MDGRLVGRLVQHRRRKDVLQNLRKLRQVHAREPATGRHGLGDPAEMKREDKHSIIIIFTDIDEYCIHIYSQYNNSFIK